MISPGLLFWGGLMCLFLAYAILVIHAVETAPAVPDDVTGPAPAKAREQAPEPAKPAPEKRREQLTPDRLIGPVKPSPLLSERERLAINTTIAEWEFLQRAWDEGAQLIRETERGE